MNSKFKAIVDAISDLTVADFVELLNGLKERNEDKGNEVDEGYAYDPVDFVADKATVYEADDVDGEPLPKDANPENSWDVVITGFKSGTDLAVVKVLRLLKPELTLPAAMAVVESDRLKAVPYKLLTGVERNRAESAKLELETAGGEVIITPFH